MEHYFTPYPGVESAKVHGFMNWSMMITVFWKSQRLISGALEASEPHKNIHRITREETETILFNSFRVIRYFFTCLASFLF